MKILVTGATGFIGRKLIDFLSKKYEVFGTSRSYSNSQNYKQVDLSNLVNEDELTDNYDVIIHGASILATEKNHSDIDLLFDNLKITNSLISIIKNNKSSLVINLSTIGVYPNLSGIYNESSLVRPSDNFEGLYGLSKLCSEELLFYFFKSTKTRIVNLRLGQTIGEGMRGDRIYSKMKDELKSDNSISVWGDGERISSFLSIDYFLTTIDKIIENKEMSGVFNLAEKNMTYLDLAKEIIAKYGRVNSKIKILSKGSKSKIIIDSSRIKKIFD